MRRTIWLAAVVAGLVSVEAFARFMLGLGTPPLYVADQDIEYIHKPSQDVWRFGNHQIFNRYGMRSEPIPNQKSDTEFRILAIGDSVLNGGNLTDQNDLATSLLSQNQMRVLNASAGSWGPQNMLAYVNKFGLFDADLLVVVLSSHDAGDVPTFAPLNPNTHPTHRPLLAITEGITRYLPRYIRSFGATSANKVPDESGPIDQRALAAVTGLASQPVATCFVLHPARDEFERRNWDSGYAAIVEAANGARIIDEMQFINSLADYRDGIHPSADGQKALAEAISACM